ncbi:TPA: hypothetical protein ACGOXR_002147, partial [Streptococcus suis]
FIDFDFVFIAQFHKNSTPKVRFFLSNFWGAVQNLVFNTIPAAGVEPARPCGHWILSSMNTFFKSYNLDLIGF